jgi:hypothetical protein
MHAETITLTQDQAEDLRELLTYAEILEDWLLHAPDDILNELARFAYHDHFHPCSAAWWLIEDLGHLGCRLRKTLPAISTSETGQRLPQRQGHRRDRNKTNGLFPRES